MGQHTFLTNYRLLSILDYVHVGGRMWARWTFDLTWEDPYSDVTKEVKTGCLARKRLGVQGERNLTGAD